MRRALFIVLAWLLPALAAAAAPAHAPDELSVGVTQFAATLNPVIDQMFVKDYVLGAVDRPLVTYDPDWKLVCMLCTELPSFENGRAQKIDLGDGKTGVAVTFTLQPNARWGDGAPVTSDDVVFSFELGKNPQVPVADAKVYRRITKIEVKDSQTFTLVLDRLTFDYVAALESFYILPAHLERAAFADPAQYRFKTLYDTDPTNPGLYAGPYRITAVVPGSDIVLERNPFWYGKQPYFRRIVIWTVENTAALEANLLAGGLDMVAGELGFSLDEALAFEQRHGNAFDILYKPGLSYEHIDVNFDNPILADLRVRQALLYGVDRKAIAEQIFAGRDPVANSFVPPLDPAYAADLPHYDYDPGKAGALLDDAGWRLGSDGIRRKNNAPLALELATTSGSRTREMIEQVLQAQWRQIGIDIRLKNQPARVLIGDTASHRKFQLAMFAWIGAPEEVPRSELGSNEIPSAQNGWGGENFGGYSNAETDRLLDAIEGELDATKRVELWRQLQVLYAEQLPALPLYFRADPFVLPKWLDGVTPTGHDAPSTLWIENWHRVEERAAK
ncbi:MAG TPA: peptide ABC transporter substrate-binding protein [Stellaceae bacterium]|jgi:peptide/nickel transport system substrate-binding protein|nr:peptide ABC transporter substrate-binding protein [Stellaceae bacterium]